MQLFSWSLALLLCALGACRRSTFPDSQATRPAPAVTASTPSRAPAATPRFAESFGLNMKFHQGEPLEDLPLLLELGVHWVRDTVDWPTLEPRAGEFVQFPAEFQRRLAFYKQHDIGVLFMLAYQNDAAYPPTPEQPLRAVEPVAFGRYARAVAERMKASGVRFALEIWNEPHNFVLRPLLSGSWNGAPPAPWLQHYVKMANEAVNRVKAFDPDIELVTDDDMWIIHYWYLEAGLTNRIDGFAFHPYTSAWPERAAVDQHTDWVRPFTVVDANGSFQSAVRRLREHGRQRLGKTPVLWASEWGWAVGQDSKAGLVTEELLAAWLPRSFVNAAAAGVKATCWFSARDAVDGPMGLLTNEGRKRLPFFAFKTMNEKLGATSLVRQIEGVEHPTSGVQAYLFRSASDYRLVIWNQGPSNARLRLSGPLANATISDVLGQKLEAELDTSGRHHVPLSASPRYLLGLPAIGALTLDFDTATTARPGPALNP